MVQRLLMLAAAAMTVFLVVPATAFAQPSDTTYGFDATCNEIHDNLDGVGVLGLPSLGDLSSAVCKGANATTHPGQAATAVVDRAWDSTFGKVVQSLMDGMGQAIVMSLVWWTKLPNERIADQDTLFQRINDYTYQAQILLLIASVILTGARLAEARRGAAMNEAAESFRMYARVVFSSWMLTAVIVAATRVSDRFSAWLLDDATNGNARGIAELMVKTSKLQAFSPGLMLIIAVVGLFGALAQMVLAVIRQGLLVVAAGFLPMAAAASGMKTGRQSYDKLVAWIVAFLLYKPVAAVVYMIAFTTAGVVNEDQPLAGLPDAVQAQRLLIGIVLLCSVAFVLPTLLRLVMPAVSVVGQGGSGLTTTGGALLGGFGLALIGGKAVGAKGAAAPGAPGYAGGGGQPPRGTGGNRPPQGGGRPSGGGGGQPAPRGGGGGGQTAAAAAGAAGAAAGPAGRVAAGVAGANAARSGAGGANQAAGDLAGDRWVNRAPDLGRSTIPR
ncbi:hypothetical protein KV203_09025 [Skermania piniformis]|uniref:TrbL/VirB6 plasmid conjugal transfer protein n=1 Tax=Skermania pinensis TaxID=39122 RepID=A0ABX8SJD0_9ACTN|nr:hypothetical protein KV203_09025 [Skermania piniformis]